MRRSVLLIACASVVVAVAAGAISVFLGSGPSGNATKTRASGATAPEGPRQARWVIRDLGMPAAYSIQVVGINERGQIVGSSVTPIGSRHAFLWQNGRMTDLGTLGGLFSSATAVSDRGQIIGLSAITGNRLFHPFLWQNGRMTDLAKRRLRVKGTYAAIDTYGEGLVGINERGQVAGTSTVTGQRRGYLWQEGRMTDLGTLGSGDSYVSAMNERGQVVGGSTTKRGERHAFLWEKGKMIDLGTLGGTRSEAAMVNERGQVVGTSETKSLKMHAFLWQNGKMSDLGTLGGNSFASAINGRGQVIGGSDTENGRTHVFLYENGKMRDLDSGYPITINERGQVVGFSSTADGQSHAFLWENGKKTNLGTLPGLNASQPTALNEHNQIVGTSSDLQTGLGHAVLWELRSN
jgi:probable HAF family extracellular repeat protein